MNPTPFGSFVGLFLIIFGSGFWLAKLGKPYNVLIQTVHKLVGVGAIVYLVYSAVELDRLASLSGGQVIALIMTSLFFLLMIATGGMLATEKEFPDVILKGHKILPYLTVVSTGISLLVLGQI